MLQIHILSCDKKIWIAYAELHIRELGAYCSGWCASACNRVHRHSQPRITNSHFSTMYSLVTQTHSYVYVAEWKVYPSIFAFTIFGWLCVCGVHNTDTAPCVHISPFAVLLLLLWGMFSCAYIQLLSTSLLVKLNVKLKVEKPISNCAFSHNLTSIVYQSWIQFKWMVCIIWRVSRISTEYRKISY